MESEAGGCNPSAPDFVPSEGKKGLLSKVEDRLGPVMDERVKEFIIALEGIYASQDTLSRNHSFQLVRLQSQVHELQTWRAKDQEKVDGLVRELKEAHAVNSDLKGKIAKLTVEFHSKTSVKPGFRAFHYPIARSEVKESVIESTKDIVKAEVVDAPAEAVKLDSVTGFRPFDYGSPPAGNEVKEAEVKTEVKTESVKAGLQKPELAKPEPTDSMERAVESDQVEEISGTAKRSFLKRVQAAQGDMEGLADQLLQEERDNLVKSLESVSAVAKKLTIDANWISLLDDDKAKPESSASNTPPFVFNSYTPLTSGEKLFIKQECTSPDIKDVPRVVLPKVTPEPVRQPTPSWVSSSDTW